MLFEKKITLPFFNCSEKLVKTCHNNQREFMIKEGGPRRAGSGEAVEKRLMVKYSKGLYQLST